MFASSSNPTPRIIPDDVILENFTDIGVEPSALIYPDIMLFCEKPTLKNAKALLKTYSIHLPLSTLFPSKPKRKKNKQKDSSVKNGGRNNTIIEELLILDTMHDLLDTEPVLIYDIFKKEMDIPAELKQSFLKSQYSFTRDAAHYIQGKANITMNNTYFDNKSKKTYDFALASSISTWTNMTFVLDNFVTSFVQGGGGPQSQGTLQLIGCAYLIVLLANMKRLNMLIGHQNITFVDGFFMFIDGNYVSRFLSLFCKSIARLTHLNTSVKAYSLFSNIKIPKYFNNLFPGANVIVEKTNVTFRNNTYNIVPQQQQSLQSQQSAITFPHNKANFFNHVKNNPKNKDLWHLNFLRDAFKADIAVESGYVFITHDRLAYTYYKLIGGQHGFLLALESNIDQNQLVHCKYSVAF